MFTQQLLHFVIPHCASIPSYSTTCCFPLPWLAHNCYWVQCMYSQALSIPLLINKHTYVSHIAVGTCIPYCGGNNVIYRIGSYSDYVYMCTYIPLAPPPVMGLMQYMYTLYTHCYTVHTLLHMYTHCYTVHTLLHCTHIATLYVHTLLHCTHIATLYTHSYSICTCTHLLEYSVTTLCSCL